MPQALVVEDDPQIASIVVRLLARRGIESTVCGTRAGVFVELNVRPRRYALAYVDTRLPDGAGADVVVELRRLYPDIPILFATGDIRDVAVDTAILLATPFTISAFYAALDACGVGRDCPSCNKNDAASETMPQPA